MEKKSFLPNEPEIRQRISVLERELHEAQISLDRFRPGDHKYTEEETQKVLKLKKANIHNILRQITLYQNTMNQISPFKKYAGSVVITGKEGEGMIGYEQDFKDTIEGPF